jgi:hypothetical protein
MTENKKEEINLEEIENAIGGETVKEETKPVKKTTTKKKTTFEEKSAEAAATAALKAVIETNNEVAIRESEKAYFIEKQRHMLERCKNDKKVTRTISKLYAPIIGTVYTFAYNGIPVTVYCDGKPHEYPEFIAKKIDSKLAKISESNTYKEVIDERLDQGTY